MQEKRRYPRIEANVYVDYSGEEVLLFHRVENISLGGLSVQAPSVEKVGTTVELSINFPDTESKLQCLGEVVWSHEEEEGRMGIKFIKLEEDQKKSMKTYLSIVDPFYSK